MAEDAVQSVAVGASAQVAAGGFSAPAAPPADGLKLPHDPVRYPSKPAGFLKGVAGQGKEIPAHTEHGIAPPQGSRRKKALNFNFKGQPVRS